MKPKVASVGGGGGGPSVTQRGDFCAMGAAVTSASPTGGHCMHSSIVLLVVLTAGKFPLSWPLRLSPCTPFHISLHTEPSCCVPGKHTTFAHSSIRPRLTAHRT